MKKPGHRLRAEAIQRIIFVTVLGALTFAGDINAQQLPPLPDRQMEVGSFSYTINGRKHRLWFPTQRRFRQEFTINPTVREAYRNYVKSARVSKLARWTSVGLMGSLFFVNHTEFSAGMVILGGVGGNILSVPLSDRKRRRLDHAVDLRNRAWYEKVRQ